MTDEQYLNLVHCVDEVMDITSQAQPANSEDIMVTSLSKEQLDKLAKLSMQSIIDADLSQVSFSEIKDDNVTEAWFQENFDKNTQSEYGILNQRVQSQYYTPKMKCLVKNEEFSSFIYLNGGWLYYEKCPLCGMINSVENHKQFLDNHVEVKDD